MLWTPTCLGKVWPPGNHELHTPWGLVRNWGPTKELILFHKPHLWFWMTEVVSQQVSESSLNLTSAPVRLNMPTSPSCFLYCRQSRGAHIPKMTPGNWPSLCLSPVAPLSAESGLREGPVSKLGNSYRPSAACLLGNSHFMPSPSPAGLTYFRPWPVHTWVWYTEMAELICLPALVQALHPSRGPPLKQIYTLPLFCQKPFSGAQFSPESILCPVHNSLCPAHLASFFPWLDTCHAPANLLCPCHACYPDSPDWKLSFLWSPHPGWELPAGRANQYPHSWERSSGNRSPPAWPGILE